MSEALSLYGPVIWAYGMVGVLVLVQLLVADIVGIRSGHTPGTRVEEDHEQFLFRATRAHANSNETLPVFILLSLFSVLSGGSAMVVNGLCWAYVVCRLAHMGFYYADLRVARSIAFGISVLMLFALFLVGATAVVV